MSHQESDFKKLYNQHVQEKFNMKKYVHDLDFAKKKKFQELTNFQNVFKRKYRKYLHTPDTVLPSNHPQLLRRKSFDHTELKRNSAENLIREKSDLILPPVNQSNLGRQWKSLYDMPSSFGVQSFHGQSDNLQVRTQSGMTNSISPQGSPRMTQRNRSIVESSSISKHSGPPISSEVPYSYETWDLMVNFGCGGSHGGTFLDDIVNQDVMISKIEDSKLSETQREIIKRGQSAKQVKQKEKQPERIQRQKTDTALLKNKSKSEKQKDLPSKNRTINLIHGQNGESDLNTKKSDSNTKKSNSEQVLKLPPILKVNDEQITSPDYSKEQNKEPVSESLSILSAIKTNNENKNTPSKRDSPIIGSRKRSNSLLPNMFSGITKLVSQPPSDQCYSIEEEEDLLEEEMRSRTRSFSYVEMMSRKKSMDKTALRLMMEYSKGANKFKYAAKLVNMGIKEVAEKTPKEEKLETDKTANIGDCRYLRLPNSKADAEEEEMN